MVDAVDSERLLLIRASVLPPVYQKVVEAKRMLSSGAARSVADAVRNVGISRSAFYKYKDCVFAYDALTQGKMITIQSTLDDRPGVLSSLLAYLSDSGVNILTINQSIPVRGERAGIGFCQSGRCQSVARIAARRAAKTGRRAVDWKYYGKLELD